MNQILYIFVDDFSNNKKEEFFEKELPFLCLAFKKVFVISLLQNNAESLNFKSENLEVLKFDFFAPCNRMKILSNNFFSIFRIFFLEFVRTHSKFFYLKNFRKLLNQLVLTYSAANNLEFLIKENQNQNTLFYSYWFKQWVSALCLIKLKHPTLKIVSRIHGADYDEDQVKSIIPFRYFNLSLINKIFSVSDYGRNYLINKFKFDTYRIITSRLGIALEPSVSLTDSSRLVIVSCSSLIPLKRVHLIIEILKCIKCPCEWLHFGSGELFSEIKNLSLETNHKVTLKGHVANSDFLEYLKNNPVSVFMNVSESEGIPVSMMEAIAHGIPLIGTSICGVPEIVTKQTGVLVPVNFNPLQVAEIIEELHFTKTIYDLDYRVGISNFYKENFFVEKNYRNHSQLLLEV